MAQIGLFCFPVNDVWVRDDGPVFVLDSSSKKFVLNLEFSGWGNQHYQYKYENSIPTRVAAELRMRALDDHAHDCRGRRDSSGGERSTHGETIQHSQ
jgi:agmatine deiminase